MKPIAGFKGVYCFDEMDKIPLSRTQDSSFVLNTDPSTKKGCHWVAIWISPTRDKSVEVYDSLVEMSPLKLPILKNYLKQRIETMGLPYRLKLKLNEVRDQRANSNSCGYFATKFILDRARHVPFDVASGYKSVTEAENALKPIEKEFQYL